MTEEVLPSKYGSIDLGEKALSEDKIWLAKAIPLFILPYINKDSRKLLPILLDKKINNEGDIISLAKELKENISPNDYIILFEQIIEKLNTNELKELLQYLDEYEKNPSSALTNINKFFSTFNIRDMIDIKNIIEKYKNIVKEIISKALNRIDYKIRDSAEDSLYKRLQDIYNKLNNDITKEEFLSICNEIDELKKSIKDNNIYVILYDINTIKINFNNILKKINENNLVNKSNINDLIYAVQIKIKELSNNINNNQENYRILKQPSEHSKIITSILFLTKNKSFKPQLTNYGVDNPLGVLKQYINNYLEAERYKDFIGQGYRHMYATTTFNEIKTEANSIFKNSKLVLPLTLKSLKNIDYFDYNTFFNEIKQFLIQILTNLMPYLQTANNNIDENGFEALKSDIFNLKFEITNLNDLNLSDEEKEYINDAISCLIDIGILSIFGGLKNFTKTIKNIINKLKENENIFYKFIDQDLKQNKKNQEDNLSLLLNKMKSATIEAMKSFGDKVVLPFASVLGASATINILSETLKGESYNFYYEMVSQPFLKTTFGDYFWAVSVFLVGILYAISRYKKIKEENREIEKKVTEKREKSKKPFESRKISKIGGFLKFRKHFF